MAGNKGKVKANTEEKENDDKTNHLEDAAESKDQEEKATVHHDFGKRWHNFRMLDPSSAILRGSWAMTHPRFKPRSRGNQGAPCSVVAIVFGQLFEPKDWTKYMVDSVLEFGDKLFLMSATRNRVLPGVYMTVNLVYPEFFVGDYKCTICTEGSSVYGNLFSESVGCPDFTDGLQRFFKTNDAGVVTTQGISVAMWRNRGSGFLQFDPSERGEDGRKLRSGTACLMYFKCMNDMRELFLSNTEKKFDSRYCIAKITILRVTPIQRCGFDSLGSGECVAQISGMVPNKKVLKAINPLEVEDGKPGCATTGPQDSKPAVSADMKVQKEPLSITISNYSIGEKFAAEPLFDRNNFDTGYGYYDMHVNVPSTFKELPGDMAILHGWTHEGFDIYKGKGAQNVTNCVMAIGMKKVHAVRSWLRPRLDEILALGDSVYAEVKVEKPSIKSMTASDMNDTKFKIENKRLIVDVDLVTVIGTISSKIPSVLNLRQALEEFFLVNTEGVLECTSMAVAVWTQEDYYYTFDPRQCGPLGVRIAEEKGKGGKGGKGKAAVGSSEKKIIGKCCVIRFPNLDSLVGLFLKNIDPAKKNDRFTLRHVIVVEDLPGLRAWNDFAPGGLGKWVLQGSITNEDESLEEESAGRQGLAIPVVALVNAKETPPAKWTMDTVDEAIRDGDAYYNWCQELIQSDDEERKFLVTDLRKDFYMKNRKIKVEYEDCTIVGNLKAPENGDQLNLMRGITQFFNTQQYGVVQVKDLNVAVWKYEEELKDKSKETSYYYFDSNARGKMGQRNFEGEESEPASCVIRTLELPLLAKYVEENINPDAEGVTDEFMIHGIKVVSIGQPMTEDEMEKDKQTPMKPDLNQYTAVGDTGACLNGSINQGNEVMFKHQTRNKQQAGTALVTLAMTKLYNPHLWYREVVDEVLKIGNKLTFESLENLPEPEEEEETPRDYLHTNEVNDEFYIGVNHISIGLDEETVTGKPSELAKSLEEFFEEQTHGVFNCGTVIMPVWKEGNVFFTMDPKGRDNRGEPKEKDGTAAVMWFMNIAALASSIQSSIEKSDEDFTIDSVTVDNEYETRVAEGDRLQRTTSTEELWHNFPKLSEGVWGFSGTVTMSDEKFKEENRDNQSAAVAVMVVVFSKVYQPRFWKPQVLDEVIITGDKLHSKCTERLGRDGSQKVNEVITEFFLSNRRIDITVKDCIQAGDLAGKPPKMQNLQAGIDKFFDGNDSGVISSRGTNIAVWKFKDFYYSVIPNSSDGGDISGVPRVLRFSNTRLLVENLLSSLGSEGDYEISGVDIVDWNRLPPWKFDPSLGVRPANLPPLNAYQRMTGARAILRGTTHQGSEIFPVAIRNRQTAANCVVALGLSVIKSPITWTKKSLDEILVVGSNVHKETTKARPTRTKIKPEDVIRVFYVGVNILTADVEGGTLTGQVAPEPPKPEEKGKGKGKKTAKPKKDKSGKQGKKGVTKREPPPPPPTVMLEEGLPKFFEKNRAGVLMAGRYMVAIWIDLGVYFIYDPRSRDEHGLQADPGTACVMWFACIEPLYDVIIANLDEKEKYGEYSIARVIIKTTLIKPLPCPAGFRPVQDCTAPPIPVSPLKKLTTLDVETLSEYLYIDEELSVLRGIGHLNDRSFAVTTRGLQSTAVAAVAIVVGLLHVPSTWTPDLLGAIMVYGDQLHADSVRVFRPGARVLSPSELLTVFIVGDFRANINIHHHTVAGLLHVYDLIEGLTLFFRNNCSGILHLPNVAVAVMQHYGKFYLVEPFSRDEAGRATPDGQSCVIKCETISRMAKIFVSNCNYKKPTVYTINAVNVLSLHFFSDAKNECPPPCVK
ncbi:uncharacterized protein [Neodiprion pinetum]|uniref:uncharacterized protein n=1 Tax=Neodiprion pinetum TaxID=441929 RepID=UPI001EDE0AE8|nr:uncharacterized protein LOC124217793 [Neodiprion pinetum]